MNMVSVIRGLITKTTAASGRLARVNAAGRAEEEFDNREVFQQYGLSSCPPMDAECLLIRSGQNVYMIASDDRRYRIALNDGEVAIYDDNNNVIHLQNGGKILIESTAEVTVKSDKVTVDAQDVRVRANKAVIDASQICLGDEMTAQSVVTVNAPPCSMGGVHAVGSQKVKAAL